VAFFIVSRWVNVLQEYERAVTFFLGRSGQQPRGPGVVFIYWPFERMVRVDMRTQVLEVPPQDVITRDNVSVRVSAVVYFRVLNPTRAIIEVGNYLFATSQLAQTTLRSVLGQADLDELLSARERQNARLQEIIDAHTDPWGVKVAMVEVKQVDLPQEMQRAMARQAEAEREKRAKIIHAEGELEASAKLGEAAEVIVSQPGDPAATLPPDPDRDLGGEELDHPLPGADRAASGLLWEKIRNDDGHRARRHRRGLARAQLLRDRVDQPPGGGGVRHPAHLRVAAFLSGVWIGRESAVRAQEKLALLTRGAAAGAATGNGDGLTTDLAKPEGQALQEFKFFADSRHRSTEAGAGNAPRPAGAPPAAAADNNNVPDAGDNADTPPAAKETPPGAAAFGDGAAAGKGTAGARGKNPPPPIGGKAAPAGKAAAASEAPAAGTAATAARSGRKAAADAHAAPPPAAEAQASAPSGTAGTPANSDVVKPRALPEGGAKSAAAAAAAGEVVIQVFSSADKEQADRVRSDGLAPVSRRSCRRSPRTARPCTACASDPSPPAPPPSRWPRRFARSRSSTPGSRPSDRGSRRRAARRGAGDPRRPAGPGGSRRARRPGSLLAGACRRRRYRLGPVASCRSRSASAPG
jgi:hypothetical protein